MELAIWNDCQLEEEGEKNGILYKFEKWRKLKWKCFPSSNTGPGGTQQFNYVEVYLDEPVFYPEQQPFKKM